MSGKPKRTWVQRSVLALGAVLSVVCLVAAAGVWYVNNWFSGISRVTIIHAADTVAPLATAAAVNETAPTAATVTGNTTTTELIAPATLSVNVLLTGSDGRACISPSSPYAGAFLGNGSNIGARSDTILVLHLDPSSKQLALLSFPRDLWVPIAGGKRKDRINSAFDPTDPNPLIQTIESTFGIHIDHYIGVDFCAFKSLVDAVGGIAIPFEYPARDAHTGLNVPDVGCHAMSGDEALAYVRSRYYEHQVNGRWVNDGLSDYGRIARQQDFIRRLASKALAAGALNPVTAKRLLDAARNSNVRIDDGLSLTDLLHLARSVRDLGPQNATSYRVEGKGTTIGGADVILPDLTSPTSKAMLAVFRGQPTNPPEAPTTTNVPGYAAQAATTSQPPATTGPDGNMLGIYPPADTTCA